METRPARSPSGGRRGPVLVGVVLAVTVAACGPDVPVGPRLTPSELELAVRERASELWDPLAVSLTEAWPGERHELEVVCYADPISERQLYKQELMPYDIRFGVSKPPPWGSGVTVAVDSAWSRKVFLRGRSKTAPSVHELLVQVSVTLDNRVRLPQDEAAWVAVVGENVPNGFWMRLYGLGQGRVAIEAPADKQCPVWNVGSKWWFN